MNETLTLRVLGEIEVLRGAEKLSLPPSKKTRALLAYLAMTGRPHRRERLCELLWDIPDDPRGALRWSLSRIRSLVDEDDVKRIVANRESVAFEREGATVDLLELRQEYSGNIERFDLETLRAAADTFRGDFLEGSDLPDYHDFQAWCVAEREEARQLQSKILGSLVERLTVEDAGVLDYARSWVKANPFACTPRCTLVNLLFEMGRRSEAEKQYDFGVRTLEDAGSDSVKGLHGLWQTLTTGGSRLRSSTAAIEASPEDGSAVSEGDGSSAMRPVVAVLPFVNMSGAAEDEYFADGLSEDKERIELTLELLEISLDARLPEAAESVLRTIEELVDGAVASGSAEHARLGLQMISKLHWERGNLTDAQDHSLRAEIITRDGNAEQRVAGLSEAAFCLILLERDMAEAKSLLNDAHMIAESATLETVALPLASGMLQIHFGEFEAALQHLTQARDIAIESGNRYREFQAIEQQFVLDFQCERYDDADHHAQELRDIGRRLRDGSEAPFAHAIESLSAYARDPIAGADDLEIALIELRNADAKLRLIYVLNRAAAIDCRQGAFERAIDRADEALRHAKSMSRISEIIFAEALFVKAAVQLDWLSYAEDMIKHLSNTDLSEIAFDARAMAVEALAESADMLVDITEGGV